MLEVVGLSRSFGPVRALGGASFEVKPGRLTGFVGANGAGKTTAMRIIMGVLRADAGEVRFKGRPIDRQVDATFGYMPEERGLYPKMAVREQLVFLAQLHGLTRAKAGSNADRLLERLGLAERGKDPVEKLSLGNQQRAQIAAALVHDPAALILDEPFSGLDPMAVDTVMGVLGEFAAQGAPILFSSHQLDVVERITDDLVIIAAGQIKAAGATAALRESLAGSRYRLDLPAGRETDWIATFPGLGDVSVSRGGDGGGGAASGIVWSFEASPDDAQRVLRQALAEGPVTRFERVIPPLSEVFREVIA
ncbi:MAG: ATP-binding cassette domain-containing protein [Bifidobacteriaceae bacterium]|jgi:ABC-2 type transport system ATP-binding protein|nr:ATP-binding cassette domain-containing protein [Bifidobacteriaceae bacterium]